MDLDFPADIHSGNLPPSVSSLFWWFQILSSHPMDWRTKLYEKSKSQLVWNTSVSDSIKRWIKHSKGFSCKNMWHVKNHDLWSYMIFFCNFIWFSIPLQGLEIDTNNSSNKSHMCHHIQYPNTGRSYVHVYILQHFQLCNWYDEQWRFWEDNCTWGGRGEGDIEL